MKKINIKQLIISIAIPLGIGFLSSLLAGTDSYSSFNKPSFSPPGYIFPIAWTILYILMGISSYMIYKSNKSDKYSALKLYGVQLIFNGLWSIIFFRLKLFFLAFVWIIVLIILVVLMILRFLNIKKLAGYLQIPYLLWLVFALILNFGVYLLN